MPLTIGPSVRAQITGRALSSPPGEPHRSPAFGDLLAMRAEEERSSQPKSFAATGMLGKGMRVVEERVALPTVHDSGQGCMQTERPSTSVGGASTPDTQAANAILSRIDRPADRPPPTFAASMPASQTVSGKGGLVADQPVSATRPLATDMSGAHAPEDTTSFYRKFAGGSETPLKFAAQLSETGLRIFARLSPLDAVERERLRSAIATVLAEYGAVADGIVLNEVPHPSERIAGSGNNGR